MLFVMKACLHYKIILLYRALRTLFFLFMNVKATLACDINSCSILILIILGYHKPVAEEDDKVLDS